MGENRKQDNFVSHLFSISGIPASIFSVVIVIFSIFTDLSPCSKYIIIAIYIIILGVISVLTFNME